MKYLSGEPIQGIAEILRGSILQRLFHRKLERQRQVTGRTPLFIRDTIRLVALAALAALVALGASTAVGEAQDDSQDGEFIWAESQPVGTTLPDFSARDIDGNEVAVSQFMGEKGALLFFNRSTDW